VCHVGTIRFYVGQRCRWFHTPFTRGIFGSGGRALLLGNHITQCAIAGLSPRCHACKDRDRGVDIVIDDHIGLVMVIAMQSPDILSQRWNKATLLAGGKTRPCESPAALVSRPALVREEDSSASRRSRMACSVASLSNRARIRSISNVASVIVRSDIKDTSSRKLRAS